MLNQPSPILSVRGLKKSYRKKDVELPVLRGVDLDVTPGRITTIVGRSGSGKSTLLHLMATLDTPDAGTVHFDGRRIDNTDRKSKDRFRQTDIGIIFQFYHLLPELTALENVLSTAMISRSIWSYVRERNSLTRRALAMLDRVGLADRAGHRPAEMSGGEMQRTAIARSLMAEPKLLLADEPTGNLDTETGGEVLELLGDLNRRDGMTILMITHDNTIAASADVSYQITDGRMQPAPRDVAGIIPPRPHACAA